MNDARAAAVLGIVGWSGSGKTTLIARLLPILVEGGLRVSTIKHAHHGFDMDRPGKDSHIHREAGAAEVMVVSDRRWALVHELRDVPAPGIDLLLERMAPVDLVLVEGFRGAARPKIEVHRHSTGRSLLQPDDSAVVAVAADTALTLDVPVLALDDTEAIARFVRNVVAPG